VARSHERSSTVPHRKVLVTEPPTRPGDHRHWGELRGSSRSLAIVDAAERFDGLTLIITSSTDEALAIEQELHFFQSDREGPRTAVAA